ncbi:MAG TPA: hypothetical protein EYP04_10265, partial [Anaerolineae bacterium]|nr:hypothetical protein [Anaerolineae bacterium]
MVTASVVLAESGQEPTDLLEIGVEYINDYPGWWNDLSKRDDDALGLYNSLGSAGWVKRFAYGNYWAWEEDFKRWSRGGTEWRYVDTVDLAYFSGHGGRAWDWAFWRTLNALVFGVGGRNHDDPYLVPGDAYHAWGDDDMEWMGFSACELLSDRSRSYWASAMNRLHLILGYETKTYDVVFGPRFARYVRWGWTLPQAWFRASDDLQAHREVVARVLAEERCHFNDRYYSSCGDYWPNGWYWYWDHPVGSEPARMVTPEQVGGQMPLFQVTPPYMTTDLAEELAMAFGMTDAPATLDDEGFYVMYQGPLNLTVDDQGLYSFINLDQLWIAPTSTLTTTSALREDEAWQIADAFLTAHNLMPADAQFDEVVPESMTEVGISEVPVSLGATATYTDITEIISGTITIAWQVIYSRIITYTPTGGDPVAFSVQGPGAKLKVYVGNDGQVIGAMGGWRPLEDVETLETVEVISPEQMEHLFNVLEPTVNLMHTPYVADSVVITRATLGYFEQPAG